MRIVTFIAALNSLAQAQSGGETISIAAPSLSEEEQFSVVIPQQYKCEGCFAVATQILHSVSRHKGLFSKRVSDDDAMEVLESACEEKNFQNYGLSVVNGKNKLTGPGIPAENVGPSPGAGFITMSGGMWPKRLSSRCIEVVSDTAEVKLVKTALSLTENEQNFANHVCKKLVRDCRGRKMGPVTNTTNEAESTVNQKHPIKIDHPIPHQRMSHDEF